MKDDCKTQIMTFISPKNMKHYTIVQCTKTNFTFTVDFQESGNKMDFPKAFSHVATSKGYFSKWQLPKSANSQAETSQVCPSLEGLLYKVF